MAAGGPQAAKRALVKVLLLLAVLYCVRVEVNRDSGDDEVKKAFDDENAHDENEDDDDDRDDTTTTTATTKANAEATTTKSQLLVPSLGGALWAPFLGGREATMERLQNGFWIQCFGPSSEGGTLHPIFWGGWKSHENDPDGNENDDDDDRDDESESDHDESEHGNEDDDDDHDDEIETTTKKTNGELDSRVKRHGHEGCGRRKRRNDDHDDKTEKKTIATEKKTKKTTTTATTKTNGKYDSRVKREGHERCGRCL
jgi:hypothetical protein